ncbi:beta-glucoside-specific PTS transporter subunit IIABC [Inconstantimicrobium mannanitabidum]|uniref:PTS beta-glucoside transporter subunit EIIBCA n=1 Tax=Inconstantimicrobium mannanitabidum TaxID=1604901 RepID=A0ACB5R996_9CLOT|nr:beta-glucoside-specific PTS transporter subunit IIABC [Clostridium sp. TW13]GKX65680.1 PTS beta-glucoside transporter subunit EIIBCA [Clostridium sp. TW13]
MNNRELATEILKYVGTENNVDSLTHCVTRLRFKLIDNDKADRSNIESLEGVLSVVESGGQFQVVIGNTVGDVYKEIVKLCKSLDDNKKTKEEIKEKSSIGSKILDIISSILSPVLAILASLSLLKALLVILVHLNYISTSSEIYYLFHAIEDGALYFMPILIALSSAKKFKTNEFIAVTLGAILLYPNVIEYLVKGGNFTFLSINNKAINYAYTFLPIIISVLILSRLEKFLNKAINDNLKFFFLPFACLGIMAPITFIIVGPVSTFITNSIGDIYEYIYNLSPIVFGGIVGGFWQALVVRGIHWGAMPIVINNLSIKGTDTFMALALCGGVGQAGAVLGVILKTKNKNIRKTALSTIPTGLLGITEPTIYGVTLKHKTPFICGSIGSAVGGAIAGYSGSAAMGYVIPGFLTLPVYFGKGFKVLLVAVAVSYILSVVLTFITFKDTVEKSSVTGIENLDKKYKPIKDYSNLSKDNNIEIIYSPLKGEIKQLSQVSDKVFAEGVLGKGIAITPYDGKLVSPIDGVVSVVFPTGHAVVVTSKEGAEILMHIGFNTVSLDGKYFNTRVTQGQVVNKGDVLVEFDIDNIVREGFEVTTPIVITNSDNYAEINGVEQETVKYNDSILCIKKK